jgi:hypothetical protein
MCLVEPYRRAARESVLATMQESGFLGFGGVPVSEAEKATSAQISAKLGVAA